MQENIDLRLAVNYLPGCICLGKTALALAFLAAVRVADFPPAYVLLVTQVALDRVQTCCRIMDSNAVVLCIVMAEMVQHLREAADPWWALWPGAWYAVSTVWAVFGACCMADMPGIARLRGAWRLAFVLTGLFVFAMSMCRSPGEHWVARVARGLTFSLLCILWTYVVGIHHRRLVSPRDSGIEFAVNFSPVLFVHNYVAMLFAAVALQVVIAGLLPKRAPERRAEDPPEAQQQCLPPSPPGTDNSMDELVELYRLVSTNKSGV